MPINIPFLSINFVSTILQLMMILLLFIPNKRVRRPWLVFGTLIVILMVPAGMELMTEWKETFNSLFWIGLAIAVITWTIEVFFVSRRKQTA